MKKTIALFVAIVLIIGILAGCSSNSENSSETEGNAANNTVDASAEDATEQTKLFRMTVTADTTLDPWGASGNGGDRIRNILYEKLLFQNDAQEWENWLAESVEKVSDTDYVVKIYDTITDTEGNHVTADDVIFSYEQASEASAIVQYLRDFDHVEKVDDYTLEFFLKEDPSVGAINTVLGNVNIVTEKAYNDSGDEMILHPVGTTGYYLTEVISGASWSFARRDDYWQTDASKLNTAQHANVEEIYVALITDNTAAAIALESGELDYAGIRYADIASFSDDDGATAKDGYVIQVCQGLSVELMFSCAEEAPTSDINLRKAIAYSLDRYALGYSIYGKFCTQMNGITTNGSDSDYGQTADDYYSYDVEKAKEYLAQSDYNGETIRVMVVTSMSKIAPLIQAYLSDIGINVELLDYDRATFNSYAASAEYGDFELVANVVSGSGYAWEYLGYIDGSNYEGGFNRFFIEDEKLDELALSIRKESLYTDTSVKDLAEYVKEQCYAIGLYDTQYIYCGNSDVVESFVLDAKGNIVAGACVFK